MEVYRYVAIYQEKNVRIEDYSSASFVLEQSPLCVHFGEKLEGIRKVWF